MMNFLDDQNISYDKVDKSFLSRKSILAQILKYTVEEFAECLLFGIKKNISRALHIFPSILSRKRLISDQKEKKFHGDDYNSIKKIYAN